MYFKDVLDGVLNGSCDAGLGTITVSTARAEAGYLFSFPTCEGGRGAPLCNAASLLQPGR